MGLSTKETQIILLLAKDFTSDYNAQSISKFVDMTPRGALKSLKALEKQGIVRGKRMGKAIFYKLNFDEYVLRLLPLLFFEEARVKANRWIQEFSELKEADALILFGSATRRKEYNDIDLLIIFDIKKHAILSKRIEEKNKILLKPVHPVWQTRNDLKNNLVKGDPVVLEIIKTGLVIKGQEVVAGVLAHGAGTK